MTGFRKLDEEEDDRSGLFGAMGGRITGEAGTPPIIVGGRFL